MTLSLSSAAQPPVITASAEWVLSSSHSANRCRDQRDPPTSHTPSAFIPCSVRFSHFQLQSCLLTYKRPFLTSLAPSCQFVWLLPRQSHHLAVSPPPAVSLFGIAPWQPPYWWGGGGELPCLLARVIITVIANARRRQPHMTPFWGRGQQHGLTAQTPACGGWVDWGVRWLNTTVPCFRGICFIFFLRLPNPAFASLSAGRQTMANGERQGRDFLPNICHLLEASL